MTCEDHITIGPMINREIAEEIAEILYENNKPMSLWKFCNITKTILSEHGYSNYANKIPSSWMRKDCGWIDTESVVVAYSTDLELKWVLQLPWPVMFNTNKPANLSQRKETGSK